MEDRLVIYHLLARGLLDIRVISNEGEQKAVFDLADLLHNIPYQLERAHKGEEPYSEILVWLHERAKQKNMSTWLDAALTSVRKEDDKNF